MRPVRGQPYQMEFGQLHLYLIVVSEQDGIGSVLCSRSGQLGS